MKALKVLEDLQQLKAITSARIGLPRMGSSIATREMLSFDNDHARARDAVHLPFNSTSIIEQLDKQKLENIEVKSAASNRTLYLQRPDLGRQLDHVSRQNILAQQNRAQVPDLAIIIADGLSTSAIHENALPFINAFLPLVSSHGWSIAPVVVVNQGRVAIADEIGELFQAQLSIMLIGERPGLSAANSMGIYMTYAPRIGRTDAERNCISNIHPAGLGYPAAAKQLERLVAQALELRLSGVTLKDELHLE